MGLRDRLRERKLSKDGLPAEAAILTNTLVDKRMTGTYVSTVGEYGHYLYEVRLVLEVRPEDGEPFRAEVQDTFKQSVFDCLPQIGGTVPVHYDPGDRSVALDLDAIVQRAENLMQDLKKTQDAKDAAVLGGADPKAARMTEAETMLGQVQGAGFMSPEMQSLAQQAQSFMGNWQQAGGTAPRPAVNFPTPTTATVLDFETLGTTGAVSAVRVRVSCERTGGEPFETTIDTAVAPHRLAELAPGAKLPVLLDPNDPTKAYPASSLL